MEEIKEMISKEIVDRYADAPSMPESDEIWSDAEYCKQLIDFLIDVKVNYGDSFDMPTTIKYLKQDIMENYVR